MRLIPSTFVAIFAVTSAFAAPILPGEDAYDDIQEALIEAEAGSVVELGAGTFHLEDGLTLDATGVTIRGQGMDATILSFKDQISGGEGLMITGANITLEDFAVEDTKGDAIKAKDVDGITFRRVRAEWTNGPDEKNGAYGLYPVGSRNVLIEESVAIGASDAGIYVGQSEDIIVRNSRAELNVAGIEIENSYRADVYGNTATKNTGGVLVFDLPGLPKMGGHDVRVFDNKIINNDTPNFAPEGNIVAQVPRGTGVMIMANKNVEVFNNHIDGHDTVSVAIVTYPLDYDDDRYNPHPRAVHVHGNKIGEGGGDPDGNIGAEFGDLAGTPIPDVVWDGVMPIMDRIFGQPEEDRIVAHSNTRLDGTPATFLDADAIAARTIPYFRKDGLTTEANGEPLPPIAPVVQN